MKKSLLLTLTAVFCVCALGLAGCGGGTANTNANSNNTSAAASVNTGSVNTGSATNSGSSSASTGNTTTSSTKTAEDAVEKVTDEGVTALSADQMQELMESKLDLGMTLSDVRSAMGGINGTLMGEGFEANTYAWYSADKTKALTCTFTSQDDNGTLISCQIGID